jgi:2-keto-4-pentenoate hydratase/2-oxohepta-3-ene-1,7-dioic acid hydratase in catechol pathway
MVNRADLRAFGRFDFGAGPEPGFVLDGHVWPIEALGLASRTLTGLLRNWDDAVSRLEAATASALPPGAPLDEVSVAAPVEPRNLFQSGANYRTHVMQLRVAKGLEDDPTADPRLLSEQAARMMDDRAANDLPYAFLGMASSISGPYDDVLLPPIGEQHDWELELAVVMKDRTYQAPVETALDHVAGYTICNDLTTRDLVFRPDLPTIGTDWLAGKNAPGFSPTGPFLVPARFVADPQKLKITLSLNGAVMQSESTADMLFSVARLIAHVSSFVEMLPGDVLLTGSPAGNGMHFGRFLRPGDVIESSISGLGHQRNRVLAGPARA